MEECKWVFETGNLIQFTGEDENRVDLNMGNKRVKNLWMSGD